MLKDSCFIKKIEITKDLKIQQNLEKDFQTSTFKRMEAKFFTSKNYDKTKLSEIKKDIHG